jgi:LacI family transcriptional regulator
MPVSLRDVAAKAGVSIGTVSTVMNDKATAGRISIDTVRRVRHVAEEMGYAPNHFARSLVQKKTNTVGLMISLLDNPFFIDVLREAESRIFQAGYRVLLDVNSNDYAKYQPLDKISGWMVDGVLMWSPPYLALTDYLGKQATSIPVVYLGHLRDDGADACAFDLYDAGRQATEHLISRGRRRFCYVLDYAPEHVVGTNNQFIAVRDACRDAGLPLEIVQVDRHEISGSCFHAAKDMAARARETRPDAVICSNDHMAISFYQGLIGGGMRVPGDIALVGFDGIEASRYLPHGPLTTVKTSVETLCDRALEILWRRIAGAPALPVQQIMIPTELVIGATS